MGQNDDRMMTVMTTPAMTSVHAGGAAVPEVGRQPVVGVLVLAVDLVEVEGPHEGPGQHLHPALDGHLVKGVAVVRGPLNDVRPAPRADVHLPNDVVVVQHASSPSLCPEELLVAEQGAGILTPTSVIPMYKQAS